MSIPRKASTQRKEIDIPVELLKDLKIIAAMNDMSVKKYMETVVINTVKEQAKKLKK